ncbi:MAG: hypothetical protein ACJ71Z_12940 [Aeromicrobium sp.]
MLSVRLGVMAALLAVTAACGPVKTPGHPAEPDLATLRHVTWSNTAQELAGVPATSERTKASLYGFGDSALGGPISVVSGDIVISGVQTERAVIVAGQSAKTGKILWRRSLPTGKDGYAECYDDDHGPMFVCKVSVGEKQVTTLWVIADRTGAVRRKIPIESVSALGLSGDELYLATFRPAKGDKRLDVVVTRRSLMGTTTAWTRKTSFAIEGWGHDGSQGFDIGRDRVSAYSASWQVIVDRATGRLLDRSDEGRWEDQLPRGGRVVLDSGDGTRSRVDVTLFSPDGRPLADLREETYPQPQEVAHDRLVLGRHLVSLATGRVVFTAPRKRTIAAVVDKGRVAVVEPIEFSEGRFPLAMYDTGTGRKLGALTVAGDWTGQTAAGGHGVVKLVQHYDKKSEMSRATANVIDVRTAKQVAVIRLGKPTADYEFPTVVDTPAGIAITGGGAVRGLVAR